jgi:hypothetical protein
VRIGCGVCHIVVGTQFMCWAFLDNTGRRDDNLATLQLLVGGIEFYLVHSSWNRRFQVSVLHFASGYSVIGDNFVKLRNGRR